jgi:broad specificity phosphatase PhoE
LKRIVFLRHTKTAYNEEPVRLRGTIDVPLSPEGFAQIPTAVSALAERYPDVKRVYSSPLERAAILAATVAHEFGLKSEKLDDLRSWDYGVLNGRRVVDVLDVLRTLGSGAGRELAPKGGESMNDFLGRQARAIHKIISEAPEEGRVVVVTHLQNIMMGKAYFEAGLPDDVSQLQYEYDETREIEPGSWIELERRWVRRER